MNAYGFMSYYGLTTLAVILLKGLFQWKLSGEDITFMGFLSPKLKNWAIGITCGICLAFLFENDKVILTIAELIMGSNSDFIMLFAGLGFTVGLLSMIMAALMLPFLTAFADKK